MFPATVLHVRREVVTPRGRVEVPQLVAYWFVNRDTVVATHAQRMLRDAWDRLRTADEAVRNYAQTITAEQARFRAGDE